MLYDIRIKRLCAIEAKGNPGQCLSRLNRVFRLRSRNRITGRIGHVCGFNLFPGTGRRCGMSRNGSRLLGNGRRIRFLCHGFGNGFLRHRICLAIAVVSLAAVVSAATVLFTGLSGMAAATSFFTGGSEDRLSNKSGQYK